MVSQSAPCPVFRVDGYAGTGKTTIIRHAIGTLGIEDVCYAAFTGKAASVMNRKGIAATTIRRLLYHPVEVEEEDPQTKKKVRVTRWRLKRTSDAAAASLIVLDEVSMVDDRLARDLKSFGRPILVLGDPGQLPPFKGAGAFMNGTPDVMLTRIHRQARESQIIEVATMARQGKRIPVGGYGDQVVKLRRAELPAEALMAADQVICGLNRTRAELNLKMRNAVGVHQNMPTGNPVEKIICLENNYQLGVLNGAFLRMTDIEGGDEESFAAKITSDDCEIGDDGALCRVDRESFVIGENSRGPRELVKACWGYAITCHKSQGSEWPRVVIIDDGWRGNGAEDRQKWLYTAITRASQKLIIAE